jgi:hypothetical protein
VSYNFTASGQVGRYTGCGGPEMLDPEEISGSATFKVLRVAPPDDAISDATYAASWEGGWVLVEFSGDTTEGPLDPMPFDSAPPYEGLEYLYAVTRQPSTAAGHSQAALKHYLKVDDDLNRVYYRETFLNRFSYGSPWFSGLDFDPGRSPEYNFLYRGDWYFDYSHSCAEGFPTPTYGTNALFVIDTWDLAAIDLAPLADELAAVPGGKGLSVLIGSVQAYYDAGDTFSACSMLDAFLRQARGLARSAHLAEMAGGAIQDAELVRKILECN